jgi:2-(1,2-epoxy-1,2-dihydrophenyl)acetyl-CoA isomerase
MASVTQQASSEFVLQDRVGEVLTLRLNRPDKLNALNVEMAQALVHALLRAGDDKTVRIVILTGVGRAFCAGTDLRLLLDSRKRKAYREIDPLLIAGKEMCLAIATMPKIVIAAVNGYAGGAGMNLALAADMRIASDKAQFSEAFARVGLYADLGGTFFLPRIVGPALAAELFYTTETLAAEDALRLGIVNRVFGADVFEVETMKLAESLAKAPPLAIRDIKRTLVGNDRSELEAILDEEIRLQMHCIQSEDCLEGLNAFFEKREPKFRGH